MARWREYGSGRSSTPRRRATLAVALVLAALVGACASSDTDFRISSGVVTTMEVRVK